MPAAQGTCPNCGAPTEFQLGQSLTKVCPFCRAVIVRTDRDFRNLGRAADLADTPAIAGVGDRGRIESLAFEVVGRVQLDYGRGPWDEFYVSFSDGSWGWLAGAQGEAYLTRLDTTGIAIPPAQSLRVEGSVDLGAYGTFRVAELRSARVITADGELPSAPSPERRYADLHGPGDLFATLDYNDGTRTPELFLGKRTPLAAIALVPHGGERTGGRKISLENLQCPGCGGNLPAPSSPSIERIACRYCKAICAPATLELIARQNEFATRPVIDLGSKGMLRGVEWTVVGWMQRSGEVEGERFFWEEYLLWAPSVGYRWLVSDEGSWIFVAPVSAADVTVNGGVVHYKDQLFAMRNQNAARVECVIGEFYWKVEAGETVAASDYTRGQTVLSREVSDEEASWSIGEPVDPREVQRAFNVTDAPQAFTGPTGSSGVQLQGGAVGWLVIIILVLVCCCIIGISNDSSGGGSTFFGTGSSGFGGGGFGGGGFGGK